MSDDQEVPGWTGTTRSHDGVEISRIESGAFVARFRNGGTAILACPCCNKRALTERAAKLIADYCYPRE